MLKFRIVNIVFAALLLMLVTYDWQNKISAWWYVLTIAAYFSIVAYGVFVISAQFFIPAYCKGKDESNAIAVTFDDGPIAGKTEQILKILDEHNVKAAFFCIGNRVQKEPEMVANIHQQGHIIGNHSYFHEATFDLQSSKRMLSEMKETDKAIESSIGKKPRFFRPPYGIINPNLAKAIKSGFYLTLGWSVRSFDTMTKDKQRLFRRVTAGLKAGDVVLFHDYCDVTIQVLPEFLQHAKKIGLNIVRLDELFNERPYF
jgi:peptidoglycan/xylan/chitin deacetylase (PgdA/CDA1 family)